MSVLVFLHILGLGIFVFLDDWVFLEAHLFELQRAKVLLVKTAGFFGLLLFFDLFASILFDR